ncbi:hypothetical protein TR51_01965 [Kitasatospora griseola]|uniref:Regulator of SigK n=1 Tax=Kitasatospora griseola TaxID=2064 RepID=A0A0D0Q1I4_KITGR|nr:anti-sigma factor [Kitasatospora griseola]KIQ66407.1 hypothetical protein TR51_01965 [Kitasatospora griseola]
MSTADLHTLTGAYAAHSLDGAERDEFERHLARCPACAQEVAEFTATLARLGAAQAVAVPEELKSRVMAALDTVRQEPPAGPPSAPRTLRRRLRRSWPRLALAACLALAAAAGGVAVQQHGASDRARARTAALQRQQARMADLLTAPDARITSAEVAGGAGVAAVVWSHARDAAGFLASGLPVLEQGTTYELWFDDAGTMRPAGLMSDPAGAMVLSGPLNGASGVGVTVEPAGGSASPTGAPVVVLSFG